MPDEIITPQGRHIAYCQSAGSGPGIVFLGGFKSDMGGRKALFLESWAQKHERAFLRFDYSGHGQSSGTFPEGCIGDWYEDALAVIKARCQGPQILIGSSMGGWIALLLARTLPSSQIAGLIGVAAAPDFTEDLIWPELTELERAALTREGQITRPSEYEDGPEVFTQRLFEDGRTRLVMRSPLKLPFPTRLLQGTADKDVPHTTALRLLGHAEGADIRLTLIKGGDHSLSSPEALTLLGQTLLEVSTIKEAHS